MRPETEAAATAFADHVVDLVSTVIRKKVGQAFEEMELAASIARSSTPLRQALAHLIFAAETSGGVAGRDETLCEAIATARRALDNVVKNDGERDDEQE
jgi:hypothetical protein